MLSLLLFAAIGQVTQEDYYFSLAQENFVMDNLPRDRMAYGFFIPRPLAEKIDMFHDPCWRCRKKVNQEIVAMGPDALRWLFWAMRSTSPQVELHASACIRGIITCRACGGSGACSEFRPMPNLPNACRVCWNSALGHEYQQETTCVHCGGVGQFDREVEYRQTYER